MVYVANAHAGFYALNSTTGEKVWGKILSQNYNYGAYSSPTVVNGVVYIGCSSGDIFAYDAFSGIQLWDAKLDGAVESSPAVVNGAVYVGSFGSLTLPYVSGRFYALDAADGTILWSDNFTQPISSSPTFDNGIVYVGCRDSLVYALNADTGNQIWNYTTYGEVNSSPAMQNGILYVISQDSSLYALNASSGNIIWSRNIGQTTSNSVIIGGAILSTSNDGIIYSFNATNGYNIWNYSLNSTGLFSDAVVVNGTIYINSQSGIYALGAKPLPISTPTQTPTVPEFPILAIPMLLIVMASAGLVVYFKSRKFM
jgi:outer membrane protein assembly factor BamB